MKKSKKEEEARVKKLAHSLPEFTMFKVNRVVNGQPMIFWVQALTGADAKRMAQLEVDLLT